MRRVAPAALTLAVTIMPAQSTTPFFLDPSLPAVARAHDVVSRMTLDEKATQLEDRATAIPRLGIPD